MYILLILSGCSINGEKEEVVIGDLVYKHIKTKSVEYYSVIGLSDVGKEKKQITIPSEVKGFEVNIIGYERYLTDIGSITSDNLEIIYIEKYIKFALDYFFIDCPKLKKIICLEFEDKVDEYYDYSKQRVINNYNKDNEERYHLPIYVYSNKDFIEDNQENLYIYANVVHYIDENEVYYIDYYNNEKIENCPKTPSKEGYKFSGWYKEPECLNKWDFENDIVSEVIYSQEKQTYQYYVTKLYAKWEYKND